MNWLRNVPIKRKLTIVILGTCSAALVLACAAMGAYQMRDFLRTKVRDTTVLADVVAQSTQASIQFEDESDAEQKLLALRAGAGVAAACIYTADGKPFARYSRAGSKNQFPSRPPPDGTRYESDALVVVRPVMLKDARIGTIFLRADLQGLYDRLRVLVGIGGAVLLGCCLVALVLSSWLQRPISEPILALTQTVRNIAERKDYTVRLPPRGRDETGLLTEGFNHLFASIEERDTALRTANESLRRSEAQLQTVVQSINEGLIVFDLNGQLLHFNRAAVELHGCATTEECSRELSEFASAFELSGMDGTKWSGDQRPLSRILRGEKLQNLEVNIRRSRDGWARVFNYGGTLVYSGDGKPMMAVLTVSDITERKLAEKKVEEQLVRLALLNQVTRATAERLDLQSILQVVVGTVEDQLPVDFCCVCLHDPGASSLHVASVGARSEGLAGELAMNPQDHVSVGQNGLSQCTKGLLVYEPDLGASPHPFPQRLVRAGLRAFVAAPLLVESTVFGVLMAARRQTDSFSSGECEFLRQVSEHVALAAHQAQLHTALQQAYDDLRQTQQAIMQQERLRALGQMASGIAHDINNAISPVALYTESLLETEPNLSARARDYLQTIQHSIEDVAQTVARMREFYRQREQQLNLLPVQLNLLIQQVVDLSRARWSDMPQQRGICIELSTQLDPQLPVIAGVESEIREALLNLVFNAVDAMPEGGKLTLRTRTLLQPDGAKKTQGASVAVEVTDTGMGMDDETRRRCLEPFFTTKGERGTGLGLAMVYGITQRHGADIEIDSQKGSGTTVRLVFPAPSMSPQSVAPAAAPLAPPARLRILLIDDDPLLIKSLRDILELDGHLVVSANGGQAGIDAFCAAQARNQPFAVVITDLGMPYVDGRKVAGAVKAASPGTPVILLTGWGQRLIAEGDVPPHVDKVLNKPPKLRALREALANLPPLPKL